MQRTTSIEIVRRHPMAGDSRTQKIVVRLLVVWLFVASLAPLLWILRMSLSSPRSLALPPLDLLFAPIEFEAWGRVFDDPDFLWTLQNSVIIAATTAILCVAIGCLAAYGFARFRFKGKGLLLLLILVVSFFPDVAIVIPLFKQFAELGIVNTYAAAIIPDVTFALPISILVLLVFFTEIPDGLEEAARVDGAGVMTTFFRIMLPLVVPGLVTAGLLSFIIAWNDYLFANTFLFNADTWTATVQIPQFATLRTTDYGAQAAASIAVTIPLVLLVMIFQKRIVSGLTSGATKG